MYYVFVVKCLLPGGKPTAYAHMICADSRRLAEEKTKSSLESGGGRLGWPPATTKFVESIFVGEHDGEESKRRKSKWDVYDEACSKASAMNRDNNLSSCNSG